MIAVGVTQRTLRLTDAKYVDGYKVEVGFSNGLKGIADLADALKGAVFEPLKNLSLFSKLKVDAELETIVWPNGADLAPEYIYFQAFKTRSEFQDQFKKWGYIA